jgi:hypothetical protein
VDIRRVWESITKSIKFSATDILGYYDLKQHKAWFETSNLLGQRKKAKLQWCEIQTNGDNMNNSRRETTRTFGEKRMEYLKEKLLSLKQTEEKQRHK